MASLLLCSQRFEGSDEPLPDPWCGHRDGAPVRQLDATPSVPTTCTAAHDDTLSTSPRTGAGMTLLNAVLERCEPAPTAVVDRGAPSPGLVLPPRPAVTAWTAPPAVLGAVLAAGLVLVGVLDHGQPLLVALTSGALQGLALCLVRPHPRSAVVAQSLGVLVIAVGGSGPALASLAVVVHVGLAAAVHTFHDAVLGWWVLALVVVAAAEDDLAGLVPVTASALLLIAVTAVRRRSRVRRALGLIGSAAALVSQAGVRELGDERALIAREVHDVVAYSVSVLQVRASSARYRLTSTSQAADEEFEALARTARTAVADVRTILDVLRSSPLHAGPER